MIIRLIDVVLIVLFGFIVISDIDIKGSLPLPSKQSETIRPTLPKRKIPIYVEINEDGNFAIFRKGRKKIQKSTLSSLEGYLVRIQETILQKEKSDIAVIIRPHEISQIQWTVDVLDLCDRNRIAKNIARKSLAIF